MTSQGFGRDAPPYYAAGLNVLPIVPGTKVPPPGVSWQRWQIRRQTTEEIDRLGSAYADADIALILGELLDIETDGVNGERALRGLRLPLPPTAMFKSPRGVHRLYRCLKPLLTRRNFRPCLDVLAVGAYVVVPHSAGRDWLTPEALDAVVDLPEAWEETLSSARCWLTRLALRDLERDGVDEGQRNVTLTRLIGRWQTQGFPEVEIPHKARAWAQRCRSLTHPFTPKEAEQVAASIIRTHRRGRSPEGKALLLARDRGLDSIARLVLVALVTLHGELGLSVPSFSAPHRLVARYAGVDRDSVGPALRRLENAGLIATHTARDPASGRSITVVAFLSPLAADATWRKSGT